VTFLPPESKYTLLLFGPLAVAVGTRTLILNVAIPHPTASDLRAAAIIACPALAPYLSTSPRQVRFAVNHEFVDDSAPVKPSDEIALIGAVSGGVG
jgi:molybdopterin converting factor small subunit